MNFKTIDKLKDYIDTLQDVPKVYRIAVGSLIFDDQDRIVFIERGIGARDSIGKLEGVGGEVDAHETNLHDALRREIQEEIGVQVDIIDMLTVLTLPFETANEFWVVPIYLCRLKSGEPTNMEPENAFAIHLLKLNEFSDDQLSEYQQATMEPYRKKYGDKPFYSP